MTLKIAIPILLLLKISAFGQTKVIVPSKELAEFKKADSTLNVIYKQILAEYASDKVFVGRFMVAQKKWLELRDADLKALFPGNNNEPYGSVCPTCVAMFLKNRTEERINYLKKWIAKPPEVEALAGTIKTR